MTEAAATNLYTALLAAQKAMGPVKKDASNPAFRSKYATLQSVIETIEEPLHANGLLLVQRLQYDRIGRDGSAGEGTPILITELIHAASGEKLDSHVPVVCKDPLDPQKVGGALTYFRRYSLLALLNLAPEDDDGNVAAQPRPADRQRGSFGIPDYADPPTNHPVNQSAPPRRTPPPPSNLRPAAAPTAAGTPSTPALERATERQVKFIWAIGQEAGMDAAAIQFWCLERYRAEVDQLNRRDAADFVEALQRKRNASEAPTPAASSPTPLTEEQERVLVQVKEMAEAKETYSATKALVQTLEIAATDEQWTEIRRRWFKVREAHYPLTIKQAASHAG